VFDDLKAQWRIAFTSKINAAAVEEWLAWRGPEINFLFCQVYRDRAVNRDLSATTVKRLVKSASKAAGLDPAEIDAFSGHSLRVGAAQDLLCAGYDAAAIMRAEGWK
jgi:integrase/recombinase XerD